MDNSTKTSPKDVFMQLLNLAALYTTVLNVLTLLFSYIDVAFRDPLQFIDSSSAIRWSLSLLIIVFPVLLLTAYLMEKDFQKEPEKRNLGIRKWFIYLTLFVSATLIIGDLVALVYNFMNGELTINFCLKILAVAVAAGSVFGYYFFDLRRKTQKISQGVKIFIWTISTIILLIIIIGFFVAGSPFKQRLIRFDRQRINDLSSLQWQIKEYWRLKTKLPATLNELRDNISGFIPPTDPQTKESYGYQATDELSFELCANFNLDAAADKFRPTEYKNEQENFWDYQAGHFCFPRTIDPDLYKKEDYLMPNPLMPNSF